MTAASLRTGNYLSMERVIMAQAIFYLAFNGNCSEAMRFCERVLGLGAKLEMMMSGADSPMAAQIPKEHAYRIFTPAFALTMAPISTPAIPPFGCLTMS
ncbi:MAG: hypothetical protein WA231_06510 [Methylocella sp.]